ncbi:MAG: putative porin [Melioribacteraceae bacterium]
MNNLLKIFSRKKILLILLFFSYQLFALDNFQVKNEKKSADSLITKTTIPKDSTSAVKRVPARIPLRITPLLNENFRTSIINKKALETTDYRTAADFFANVPFGFVRDLGSIGQPNEVLIYGQGFGNVSFLSDGISINNRLSNALDLNLFQSESIDSIEVIPLSRGFLYGGMNNPVSINFISRQPELRKPYSRIKYYQAPNSEGLIDGIFILSPFKRINAFFEITNQNTNPTYTNQNTKTLVGTDHSNWMGSVRLHYLLTNNINIIASYKYIKTITQLFGGIDADSISRAYFPSQFDQILYDKFSAPVRFTNRYQKISGHNLILRLLGNFIEHSPTDISFYYQSNLTEFRQNENSFIFQNNTAIIFDDNESKTIGFYLRQDFKFDFLKLTSITNLERNSYNSPLLSQETFKPHFSTTAIASIKLFNNALIPSLSARYLNYSNNDYIGIGADLFYALSSSVKLYAGFSSFDKPRNIWEERFVIPTLKLDKQKISTMELSAAIDNNFAKIILGYFSQSSKNALLSTMYTDISSREQTTYFDVKDLQLQGINLNLNFKIWKLLFSTNSSYYFSLQNRKDYKLPEFTSYGGVYYVDTLFNNNLKLKAGLNYSSIGGRSYTGIDFEKNISSYYSLNPFASSDIIYPNISSSFQLDFFLAGKIQNSATVYFVFENLFNAKYFIVPYYPKQARGIRFGVAWEFLD